MNNIHVTYTLNITIKTKKYCRVENEKGFCILLRQIVMAQTTPLAVFWRNNIQEFDVQVAVHRDKFLLWNQLDALISQIYFWNKILHVSDSSSVHHQEFFTVHTAIHTGLLTACEQDQFRPFPARKLSANLYDIHHCCVCTVKNSWWWTEELSETCRVLFQKQIWEISASSWFYYKNIQEPLYPLILQ